MSDPQKTNACRQLDALGIRYELRSYDVDEEDLAATSVAAKVGLPAEQVYKTLCLRGHSGALLFAIVAADRALDLKALAKVAAEKSVEPVAVKELPGLTGYIRGGVTALAVKKALPVFVDDLMPLHDTVSVSAGQRGLQVLLAPGDYITAVDATVAAISRDPP